MGERTYVAFVDITKAYDTVPIPLEDSDLFVVKGISIRRARIEKENWCTSSSIGASGETNTSWKGLGA